MASDGDEEESFLSAIIKGLSHFLLLAAVVIVVYSIGTYCLHMIKTDRGAWYHWLGMSVITGFFTLVFMLLSNVSSLGRNNSGTNLGLTIITVILGLTFVGSLVAVVSTAFGWA